MAKRQGKLLLVNLQDSSSQVSAQLNLLWRDPDMKEQFVFWQHVRVLYY
jgi:hypothetical protein